MASQQVDLTISSLFATWLAAGMVALARWLHPATFSVYVLWGLLVAAFGSAVVMLMQRKR